MTEAESLESLFQQAPYGVKLWRLPGLGYKAELLPEKNSAGALAAEKQRYADTPQEALSAALATEADHAD